MQSLERWRRATLCAAVTALVIGVVTLLLTIRPVNPGFVRTSAIALVASAGLLFGLSLLWYWVLKLLRR